MIAQVLSGSGELALCDNGATVNCDKHGVGVIAGTEQALSGQGLVIGDESATLHANVTRLHLGDSVLQIDAKKNTTKYEEHEKRVERLGEDWSRYRRHRIRSKWRQATIKFKRTR